MIGLPTKDVVVHWLEVSQELAEMQRVERIIWRLEGTLYRSACLEVGVQPMTIP